MSHEVARPFWMVVGQARHNAGLARAWLTDKQHISTAGQSQPLANLVHEPRPCDESGRADVSRDDIRVKQFVTDASHRLARHWQTPAQPNRLISAPVTS